MTVNPKPATAVTRDTPSLSASTKALIGVLLAGTVGIIIFLFVHLSANNTPSLGSKPAAAACGRGEKCLPDLNLIDTYGTAYSKQSLAGKVVVINFWATWCGPCKKELPDLSKIADRYKDRGVVVLGVLANDNPDNSTLLNFMSDADMTFPTVRWTPEIMAAFEYPGNLPTTFIYDRAGIQKYSHIGALRADQLAGVIEPLATAK